MENTINQTEKEIFNDQSETGMQEKNTKMTEKNKETVNLVTETDEQDSGVTVKNDTAITDSKDINDFLAIQNGNDKTMETQTFSTLARIPETGNTHASGDIIISEGSRIRAEKANMREELIRKIEELEKQKMSLKQRQLIKEIRTLQTEVQGQGQGHGGVKGVTFMEKDAPVIINNSAPIATEITNRSHIDLQLQEIDEKIEKTSKHVEERKKQEDLTMMSTDELQKKVKELKHRKELLSKFRQKAHLITLIQRLHKQVSGMKKKNKDDKVIPSDHLKCFVLSPSELDIYWDQRDFLHSKHYTLLYREESPENDAKFSSVRLDTTKTSYVIENLKAGKTYEVKFEALANEGYGIFTEPQYISTYKPVTGYALILTNHSDFHISQLKNQKDTQADVNAFREHLEYFGFEVCVEENLTGKQLLESVEKHSAQLENDHVDCFICVTTGYMYNGYMYGIDGVPVSLHKLFEPLRMSDHIDTENPCNREGKVKIIFVDAFKVREKIVEDLDESFQPREVQFRSSSNKSIETSWKRPKLSRRPLKGFKLLLKNTSSSRLQIIPFNKQQDCYFFKFTKLVPDTEYNLEISAEYQDSDAGKPVKATLTTFEPKFMQPRKLSVEAVSTSQVYVYWIPPVQTSRTILGYKVSIRDQIREEYSEQITTYTCCIFGDLTEDTEYNISVRTIIKGEIIDYETEVEDTESKPVYIDITTLKDRTPFIMTVPTVNYVLEEPDFYIASATASTVYDGSKSSFLNIIGRHLMKKYQKSDLHSILEDVKREIISSTDNYETPQSLSTLRKPVFFGKNISSSYTD